MEKNYLKRNAFFVLKTKVNNKNKLVIVRDVRVEQKLRASLNQ